MADYDSIDISGGDIQCFRPGASVAATTSLNLSNVAVFMLGTAASISYGTGDFSDSFPLPAGMAIRPPKDATTLTISPAATVAYMRKEKK
jgi:hypothetical protein